MKLFTETMKLLCWPVGVIVLVGLFALGAWFFKTDLLLGYGYLIGFCIGSVVVAVYEAVLFGRDW